MSSPVDIKHTLYSTADVCMPDSSAADKCGLYLLHVTGSITAKQNPPHSHTSAAPFAGAKCTLTCCRLLDCELFIIMHLRNSRLPQIHLTV